VQRRRWRSAITDLLEDLPRQITALDYSYSGFADAADFASAFESEEPVVYVRVLVLERGFGRIQNYVADMVHNGVLLSGIPIRQPMDGEPQAQPAFEVVRDAGVIPADMAKRFIARQKVRAAIEHRYPKIAPRQLYEAAGELLVDAPRFSDRYAAWIRPFLLDG
jgi:hypothetical protein